MTRYYLKQRQWKTEDKWLRGKRSLCETKPVVKVEKVGGKQQRLKIQVD